MAIKDYKNYDNIKDVRTKAQGSFIDDKTSALVSVGVEFPYSSFGGADDRVEFHAYTIEDNPLGSKHENCHYELVKKKGSDGAAVLNLKPSEELKQIKLAKGGIIKDPTYTYYDEGGPVKPPVKDEIEVKKIDLDSELSKLGNFFLRMNNRDRATVIDLLKKSGVIKD